MFSLKDMKYPSYLQMWKNGGTPLEDPSSRVNLKDAISVPDAGQWLPKVVQTIVKEAQEPMLVGASLLQRLEYRFGQFVVLGATGTFEAAEIAEGMAYPERKLGVAGGTVTAKIGKVGVAVAITEEMERYSSIDIVNWHLREAGRALARHKEKKIMAHINSLGLVTHDNLVPTSSVYGVTQGRARDGTANGSAIMEDLFDAYTQVMLNGFMPDTLLMHPLCWNMWVKDPTVRAFMMSAGGGTMFGTWTGGVARQAPWGLPSNMGMSGGQEIIQGGNAGSQTPSTLLEYPQTMDGAPKLPSYFPFPFRIIVSPFAPFEPATKLTNIMLFDSRELGALLVDEDVTMDEWNDQSVDIRKIKLRERYAIAIFNEGQGIAVLRNVRCIPNEVSVEAAIPWLDVSGFIALTRTTPVVI